MATCYVYLRRSSNRDKRQENSIEIQTEWAMDLLAEKPDLEVLWLDGNICSIPYKGFISESASAKEENRKPREAFWKMLDLIRKKGVDYVIVYHPSRISRNNEDMESFMKVFDPKRKTWEGMIGCWVITDLWKFFVKDPQRIVAFEKLLNDAKADNEMRSIYSKKNEEFYKRRGIYPHLFPFWYESIWERAAVRIKPERSKLVEMAFNMRRKGCQWEEIRKEFSKAGYDKTGATIKKMLSNPIYYGEFLWKGELHPIKNEGYNAIISKPLFDEVQAYNEANPRKHGKSNPLTSKKSGRLFDKMVYDTAGQPLQGYPNTKTGGIFYRQPTKGWVYKVNISETKLIKEAKRAMSDFKTSPLFVGLIEIALQTRLRQSIQEEERKITSLEGDILSKEEKIQWLTDRIATTEEPELIPMYEKRLVALMKEKKGLEGELKELRGSSKDIRGMAIHYAKHFGDLSKTFSKVSNREKANILRGLGVFFVVGPDRHITVMNNEYDRLFVS